MRPSRTVRAALVASALILGVPSRARSQPATPPDTSIRITLGGFVDGYYAWDSGRPPSGDRSFAGGTPFTTQPARHNEFNVNLAFVEMKLDGARVRGRVALQAGTSVQSNYAGEPATGLVSGPGLSRIIQEAVVGAKIADNLWVDGGIFFSHMGMESWISRDNPTYTRSLVAEYSPYYQSGAKLTWTPAARLTAQLDIVNGWQNIAENNSGKGAGIRLDYALTPSSTLSYYDFFSDEAGSRLRTFNGIGARTTVGSVTLLGQADVGTQKRSQALGGSSTWYGVTAIARVSLSPAVAIAGRVERYDDRDQVIVGTGSVQGTANGPFRANGASLGLDVTPQPRLLWRTEARGLGNRTAIFPDAGGEPAKMSAFIVTSLALTF